MTRSIGIVLAGACALAGCGDMTMHAPDAGAKSGMTFFVTSSDSGHGADFGGLAGADKHCQMLADAAGAGGHTWHAYLSTQGPNAVNARDRIGKGPWRNEKGVVIANNVDELHGNNNITKETALTDKGQVVNGFGDTPNRHDILTGSRPDGTAFPGADDTTCGNYTSNADTGSVMLGHFDRTGGGNTSWNSAHASRGCSQPGLVGTGGAGLLYCFAAN